MDLILSERLAEKARKGRDRSGLRIARLPIMPAELWNHTNRVFRPTDYHLLRTCDDYQRRLLPSWSGLISEAVSRGTTCPPIDVCSRQWEPEKVFYIVDGLQRAMALMRQGLPVPARVHNTNSIDDERLLFRLLNATKAVSTSQKILSDPGPASAYLRELDQTEGHPAYRQINWARNHGHGHAKLISATQVFNDVLILIRATATDGAVELLNGHFEKAPTKLRLLMSEWLTLLRKVWPESSIPAVESRALAAVLSRNGGPGTLTRAQIGRVKRIKWKSVMAATSTDRNALLQRRIRRALGIQEE